MEMNELCDLVAAKAGVHAWSVQYEVCSYGTMRPRIHVYIADVCGHAPEAPTYLGAYKAWLKKMDEMNGEAPSDNQF